MRASSALLPLPFLLVLLVAGPACAPALGQRPRAAAPSLYERLGGRPAITAVVEDLLRRVAADPRINARFANADVPRLGRLLVEQICAATGGPCVYTGRDMKTAHLGMRITDAEFDALAADLQASLQGLGVPAAEQRELLAAVGGMRADIVEAGAAAGSAGPGGGAPAPQGAPASPVRARAEALREAASLLDRTAAAQARGDRWLAEQLFSAAELLAGSEALAPLAQELRQGAPPRVTSPLAVYPKDAPPQPRAVGSSEDEEPAPARPRRGSLVGTVSFQAGPPADLRAVVTLEPLDGPARRRPPRHRVVEQRNREFAPRLLAVPVGSTVRFPNLDAIYHNVFSRSETKPFDLGIYKAGQTREVVFEKEGIVRVGCNLHANMAAHVVVVAAPHYAVTGEGGGFAFRSLDPGRYRLRAYGERGGRPLERTVEIKPERNAITLELGAEAGAPPTDKFGAPRAVQR